MDFELNEQERMLQGTARKFAESRVRPLAAEIDQTCEFPFDLAQEMGALGFRGLPYPDRYGGVGAGYLSYALVLEQVCRASMTVGAIIAINTVPEEAIFRYGTEEQKSSFLIPLAQGTSLSCIAFTESETGSDPRMITTRAKLSGDNYVISGQKHFVALAPAADLALVFAQDEQDRLDAFVVDTASPGFHRRDPCETMGLRGLGTSVVYLDDVSVPQQNLLGDKGQGFEILLEAISLGRLGVAVEGVGVAQAALELSIEYAQQRVALGKPIAELPSIQGLFAEMVSKIEAARWLTYRTAFLRDRGNDIRYQSSVAKLFSSQIAVEVTRMAMQVHGSYGTMKTLPIERLYRDAKITEIYVGISEIQRALIANCLIH